MNSTELVLLSIVALQFAVIGAMSWRSFNSIPPQVFDIILGLAQREAAKTPDTWDDEAVNMLSRMLSDLQARRDLDDSQFQEISEAVAEHADKAA